MQEDGGTQLLAKEGDTYKPILTWKLEDAESSHPIEFTEDENTIYLQDSRNANAAKLVRFNIKTGKIETVIADDQYDVGGIMIDDDTYQVGWVTFQKDKMERVILDPKYNEDFEFLAKIDTGEIGIASYDDSKNKFIVVFDKDNGPVSYYIYDRKNKKAKFLFYNRPELTKYKLANMEPISFQSRDGLTIHGYLTLPIDKEHKNLPLVLDVHGGPATRDTWGYNSEAQWLANRGYAVMQVNYRGSKGYGKKFLEAGNREWAGKMHDDLLDAVNWAVSNGIANPKKIAIYGGLWRICSARWCDIYTRRFLLCY